MLSSRLKCLRIFSSSCKGFQFKSAYKGVFNIGQPSRKMNTGTEMRGDRLVWVDMEMTGLDPDINHILEVACIVTDGNLNVIAEGPNLVIHQPPEILSGENDWCLIQHDKSGLNKASASSKISLKEAEDRLLAFIEAHTLPGKCPLAGNSVYGDRMFLRKHMPRFDSHLHYRLVDVSTVKELCRRWFPDVYEKAPEKILAHRSLADIKESIDELKYYRSTIFNLATEPIIGSIPLSGSNKKESRNN